MNHNLGLYLKLYPHLFLGVDSRSNTLAARRAPGIVGTVGNTTEGNHLFFSFWLSQTLGWFVLKTFEAGPIPIQLEAFL